MCLVVFNNPFDPAYKSTHAKKVENFSGHIGNIQVEQVFQMYQLNQHVYAYTGQTANINRLPFCIKNTTPDTIYKFPLKYGDTLKSSIKYFISIAGIGYFERSWQRKTVVDTWGLHYYSSQKLKDSQSFLFYKFC